MEKIDIVFVVLTYRNSKDLLDFIESLNKKIKVSYKIIVVNSFYDELSKNEFKDIAVKNNCDFINVPNEGYGSGNNKGIKYANKNYNYNFLTICNPDTEIIKFNFNHLIGKENYIIAPEILTSNKKKQNPFRILNSSLLDWIKYKAFKEKKYKLIYIDIIVNKIAKAFIKTLNNLIRRSEYPIYSCHGSFLIIGKKALDKLGCLYNEKMFLFSEEDHIAKLAAKKNIVTLMNHNIQILHKEDGSVKFLDGKIMDMIGQSYIEYYKHWYLRN